MRSHLVNCLPTHVMNDRTFLLDPSLLHISVIKRDNFIETVYKLTSVLLALSDYYRN